MSECTCVVNTTPTVWGTLHRAWWHCVYSCDWRACIPLWVCQVNGTRTSPVTLCFVALTLIKGQGRYDMTHETCGLPTWLASQTTNHNYVYFGEPYSMFLLSNLCTVQSFPTIQWCLDTNVQLFTTPIKSHLHPALFLERISACMLYVYVYTSCHHKQGLWRHEYISMQRYSRLSRQDLF